jgi:hypothetical protein
MQSTSSIRRAVQRGTISSTLLVTLCGSSWLPAQTAKPSAAVADGSASGHPVKPHLSVEFVAGKLSVTASNASLNQILSEVSHAIGMKITGGVADERVFGQYGPAAPAVILATLLDGTGSNMLLVDDAKGPTELILTPRQGGPTPPSPAAARPEPEPEPEEHAAPEPRQAPAEPRIPPRRGMGHPPGPGSAPELNSTGADSTNSNPDESSTQPNGAPQSPNGTKTPQQIYNELRQQQQTQPAPQ